MNNITIHQTRTHQAVESKLTPIQIRSLGLLPSEAFAIVDIAEMLIIKTGTNKVTLETYRVTYYPSRVSYHVIANPDVVVEEVRRTSPTPVKRTRTYHGRKNLEA